MSKKKILFIEDEPEQILMVKTRIEANGYEFLSASDGNEGLKKVREDKPDLILLDILLPGMSGEEICKQVRDDPSVRNIPIIIITALDADDLRQRCLVVGAKDWIHKPYDSSDLLDKIKALIG